MLICMDKGVKRFILVLQVQQVTVSGCEVKNNIISVTFGKTVTHTSLSCFVTKDQIMYSNRSFTPEPMMCTPAKDRGPDPQKKEFSTSLKSQLMFRAAQVLGIFLSSHRCPFPYFL